MFKLELKGDLLATLESDFDQLVNDANKKLGPEFKKQAEKDVYEWPRETVRQNGQTVSSPRDVIDSGDGANSHEYRGLQGDIATHVWTAEHMDMVVRGAILSNGTRYPARDFPGDVLRAGELERLMRENDSEKPA